jgi:hypothetical protein
MYTDYRNLYRGIAVPMVKLVDEFRVEGSNNGVDFEESWDYKSRRQVPRYVRVTVRYRKSPNTNEISEYVTEVRPPILWN